MTHTSQKPTLKLQKKYFRSRDALLHFVASTDYENGVMYYTNGGKTWFKNNRLYRDGLCIGRVDRETEQVFIHIGMHLSGYLWSYQNQLKDAFKHYKAVDVTAFNVEEAWDIFEKCYDKVITKPETPWKHEHFVKAYDTLKLFDVSLCEQYQEQYKKSFEAVEAERKRVEEEKRAYEKAVEEYHKECYQAIEKYLPKVLKGKNWNEKLKNFSRDGIRIPLKEWKVLNELSNKYPIEGKYIYQDIFSVNGPSYGRREDGTWGNLTEYPEKPTLHIHQRVLNDMKGLPNYADMLYIDGEDIHTTRGVTIRDTGGLVRKLLKRFVACKTNKEREKFVGLHVGSYIIREWNCEELYLQIGCHRFYMKTLKEFADFIKKGK